MLRHVSTHIVPLTANLAREFHEMRVHTGERPFKEARAAHLARMLDQGWFYPPRLSRARVGELNENVRVNGQHVSAMLMKREQEGRPFPTLTAIVDAFYADTLHDLATLFGMFDGRITIRSIRDSVVAHARVHRELATMSTSSLVAVSAGVVHALYGTADARDVTDEQRARVLHENIAYFVWVEPLAKLRILQRSSVMSALFLTYRVDQDDALAFWQLVADESHPDPRHPTRVLRRFLTQEICQPSQVRTTPWGVRAFHVKCIHAWNAYRRNTSTDLSYYPNRPIPKAI